MDKSDTAAEAVSEQFRDGLTSEYGAAGRQWLAGLAQLLESLCTRWELELTDPSPLSGYLSLVRQVALGSELLAVKVTVPSETFAQECAGLVAWDGQAMVRLHRYDVELGAALLQWLDASVSLADVPIGEAVAAAGPMLAITPAIEQTSASLYPNAYSEAVTASHDWPRRSRKLDHPLSPEEIRTGQAALARINQQPQENRPELVNHDLHDGTSSAIGLGTGSASIPNPGSVQPSTRSRR